MNAVGDGVDGELREHFARNLAVLHGHAVGIARKPQRQQRHVQHAVVKAAQLLQACRAVAAQDANGLLGVEAVMPGRNRRVRGEDALFRTCSMSASVAASSGPPPSCALQQGQRQQRRVAFVHVVDIDAAAQRVRHAHSAHAQHNLLLQAVVGVAAIQVVGQTAVPPEFPSRSVSSR